MTIEPTWAEVIREAIESRLIDVHTALPGRVKPGTYDSATQTADIILQVNRQIQADDDSIISEKLPVLPSVKIGFFKAGDFSITFPIQDNNPVFVIFSEVSLDMWRGSGDVVDPGDIRRHSLTGGVAIPILYPDSEVVTGSKIGDDLIIGEKGDTRIHIKPGGACEVTENGEPTAHDWVAMAGLVLSELQDVKTDFANLLTSINTHTHPVSGAATGTPTPPVAHTPHTPASVESSNLKAGDGSGP
jgi:hypothetical protein